MLSILNEVKQSITRSRGSGSLCLGCSAVFLVVLVTSVSITIVEKAPLAFLREAEVSEGQRDVVLTASASSPELVGGATAPTSFSFLNYSRVANALTSMPKATDFSYHSPRVVISGTTIFKASDCDLSDIGGIPSIVLTGNFLSSRNSWMYGTPSLFKRCKKRSGSKLIAIDSLKEARMGYGRQWQGARIPPGKIILSEAIAHDAGNVRIGDIVIIAFQDEVLLRSIFSPDGYDSSGWESRTSLYSFVAIPLVVHGIVSEFTGKVQNSEHSGTSMIELSTLINTFAPNLHPLLGDGYRDVKENDVSRIYEYASEISVNLPPYKRVNAYMSPNYENVRGAVADFASSLLFASGFTEVAPRLPLLSPLGLRRFVTIYLGILLNVLFAVLFALSAVLIYSLLLINVSTRTFELAVRRMLGSGRPAIIGLLLVQAASYSIPALFLGLHIAQIISSATLVSFSQLSGISISTGLTSSAVWTAVFMATAITAVSSIGPIRVALGPTIREALDTHRPKATLISYSIDRTDDGSIPWAILVIGSGMFVFGFAVYYLLPLSLISLNLSLLASVFVSMLLGMLIGLVQLALNLELLVSRTMAVLFVSWWENGAIVKLAMGNLIAHRLRNRKTFLMYSLAVSFIVLLTVAAEQQIRTATYADQQRNGAALVVRAPPYENFDPAIALAIDTVVQRYGAGSPSVRTNRLVSTGTLSQQDLSMPAVSIIAASAWTTMRLDWALSDAIDTSAKRIGSLTSGSSLSEGPLYQSDLVLGNMAHSLFWTSHPQAVSPSTYSSPALSSSKGATFDEFNIYSAEDVASVDETSLSLSEQLYTARGSQSFVGSSMLRIELALRRNSDCIIQTKTGRDALTSAGAPPSAPDSRRITVSRTKLSSIGMMEHSSYFRFSRNPIWTIGGTLLSFPSYSRVLDEHVTFFGAQRVGESYLSSIRNWNSTSFIKNIPSFGIRHNLRSLGISDIPLTRLFISFQPSASSEMVSKFISDLSSVISRTVASRNGVLFPSLSSLDNFEAFDSSDLGGCSIYDVRNSGSDDQTTVAILNLVFSILTLVAMALCSFSLFASMSTNITEQSKEVGVLLALGLKPNHLVRVYALEAFVLVVSACFLGIGIGTFVAWSFGLQQYLFSGIPVPSIFPFAISLTILIASVVAAFFASAVPALELTKTSITTLLRS